jgi:hypothetical protein
VHGSYSTCGKTPSLCPFLKPCCVCLLTIIYNSIQPITLPYLLCVHLHKNALCLFYRNLSCISYLTPPTNVERQPIRYCLILFQITAHVCITRQMDTVWSCSNAMSHFTHTLFNLNLNTPTLSLHHSCPIILTYGAATTSCYFSHCSNG